MRTYRALLRLPGAGLFVAAGFVGRLPMAMRGVGCLLLVSATTGSYALAGAVTAVLTLTQALVAPALGRAADRHGQAVVLVTVLAAHVAGTGALVLLALAEQPGWTLVAAAAVAGASALPIGPLVRARWTALVGGTSRLTPAFALESVLDEVIYVGGPILVTALAVQVSPAAGLVGAAALTAMGSLVLAAARGTEPPRSVHSGHGADGSVLVRGVGVVLMVYGALGVFLGAVDVGVIAFATEHGATGAAGVLLALLAFGSLVAGLFWGVLRSGQTTQAQRFTLCAFALAVVSVPLLFAGSPVVLAICMVLAGVAVSPTLITGSALIESLVPRAVLTEGFAWMSSAVSVGTAAGAAAGGKLVDAGNSRGAFALAAGSGVVAAVVVAIGRRRLASEVRTSTV